MLERALRKSCSISMKKYFLSKAAGSQLNFTRYRFLQVVLMRVLQKQPSRDVLWKRCSENMQQIYRKTPMSKYNFNKVA